MASLSKIVLDSPGVIVPRPSTVITFEKVAPDSKVSGDDFRPPLIKRASSLETDPIFSQVPIRHSTTKEDLEDHVETFEAWRARASATVLQTTWMSLMVRQAYVNSSHWSEWVSTLVWYLSLFSVPRFWVHKERTPLNTLGFLTSIAPIILQPHTQVAKKLSYIGAIHGSASVIVTCRALQYWFNQEDFKDWKPWRRLFFISAWGWHDMRQVKFVGEGKLEPELKRFAKWGSILGATVLFHMWWGRPADLGEIKNIYSRRVLRFFFFRWVVGFWTLLAWFNTMDAFPRALHFWADGHELRHISEDPWGARTLRDFWGKRWNVPVQEMLLQGVFKPLNKMKWLPLRKTIAKLMVFVVSAAGHTYAISCGGSPRSHLISMFSFFMLQIPLLGMEEAFKLEGLQWMLGAELPLAPLFIEPCLSFVHL